MSEVRENTIAAIQNWFGENEEVFNNCIEELDSYNGYLGDDRYYPMDELDELMSGRTVTEVLNMAFFGHDEETWATNNYGEKEYGAFNPNREYFTFNGYGNLVSADYKDYSAFLDDYVIETMSENRRYIDTIDEYDELAELFDELEEEN